MQRRHHRQRVHHRAILWVDQHWTGVWYGLLIIAGLLIVLTVFQIFYPANRTLPFVHVAGQSMGTTAASTVEQRVGSFTKQASVSVRTDKRTFTWPLADAGVTIDAAATASEAADYPFLLRLVPLSSIFVMGFRDTPLQVHYNDEQLARNAQQVAAEGSVPAKNASAKIAGKKVELVKSEPSKTYPETAVLAALHNASYMVNTTVVVVPKTQPASRSDKAVQPVIERAQKYIDTKMVLNVEGEKKKVAKEAIASWLTFTDDATTGQLVVGVNSEAVQKYVQDIRFDAYKQPGTTTVRTVDGREVSRKTGASGHGVQVVKGTEIIAKATTDPNREELILPTGAIEPILTYDKHYTNSDTAFASLVQRIAANKGDYGIAVMEMDGRSASAHGDRQYIAASTYKVYVAYAVFKSIEAGRMSWSDGINGSTVEKCFEVMITRSDNPCAQALGQRIGWSRVQQYAYDIGVSKNTSFTTSEFYTTASDLAYMLYRMENRSIITESEHARLVRYMKVQIYRDAIPAGTGVTVADKPGFLYALIHDAGIVYASKGTYIMVIMTDGSSWSQMADAAHQIHTYVNK